MLFAIFLAVAAGLTALVCGATLQQLLGALVLALVCLGRGRADQ